jgi:hypothetical protein
VLTSTIYDGVEGAQVPDANERSEDKPAASYIWALVIGSMIEGLVDTFSTSIA